MAQLPPKIPTIIPNYNNNNNNNISLPHHRPPPPNNWADDFLDFSSTRRGAHRRSASDSFAFLDYHDDYDVDGHLLLVSMFSEDDTSASAATPVCPTSPPPPSDQNSSSNVVVIAKVEPGGGEVESVNSAYGDEEDDGGDPHAPPMPAGGDVYPFNDPKRVKRILANRQSAQRSRVRKLHYISELERSVTALQAEVSVLSPRVAYLDHQRLILNVDNGALKQRIAALAQDKIFKDAHQDALKKEIERLRRVVYERQNQNNKSNNSIADNGNHHHQNAEQRLSSIQNDDIAMGCTNDDACGEKIPN